MQYNGKQIHSGMDEPSGRYAKTIVLLLLHPSFNDEKLSEREISMPQSKAATLRAKTLYRDNDTSAQPQSERITIQGYRKSIAFVGKESNRLISDAFADRQNEPKGEL